MKNLLSAFFNQILIKNPDFDKVSSHINNDNRFIWHLIQFTFTLIATGVDVGNEFIIISGAHQVNVGPDLRNNDYRLMLFVVAY